jgi:hypothetical protein
MGVGSGVRSGLGWLVANVWVDLLRAAVVVVLVVVVVAGLRAVDRRDRGGMDEADD